MSVDPKALEAKLREMYPGIEKHGCDLSLNFNDRKNAWIVKLSRGDHELTTHLEEEDARRCLEGVECVYLGVQIGQFVNNFELVE